MAKEDEAAGLVEVDSEVERHKNMIMKKHDHKARSLGQPRKTKILSKIQDQDSLVFLKESSLYPRNPQHLLKRSASLLNHLSQISAAKALKRKLARVKKSYLSIKNKNTNMTSNVQRQSNKSIKILETQRCKMKKACSRIKEDLTHLLLMFLLLKRRRNTGKCLQLMRKSLDMEIERSKPQRKIMKNLLRKCLYKRDEVGLIEEKMRRCLR